jgi:hypothetical protein
MELQFEHSDNVVSTVELKVVIFSFLYMTKTYFSSAGAGPGSIPPVMY